MSCSICVRPFHLWGYAMRRHRLCRLGGKTKSLPVENVTMEERCGLATGWAVRWGRLCWNPSPSSQGVLIGLMSRGRHMTLTSIIPSVGGAPTGIQCQMLTLRTPIPSSGSLPRSSFGPPFRWDTRDDGGSVNFLAYPPLRTADLSGSHDAVQRLGKLHRGLQPMSIRNMNSTAQPLN